MKYWDAMTFDEKIEVLGDFLHQFKCDLSKDSLRYITAFLDSYYLSDTKIPF